MRGGHLIVVVQNSQLVHDRERVMVVGEYLPAYQGLAACIHVVRQRQFGDVVLISIARADEKHSLSLWT